jgi:CRP/FNR family transcriptional regulator, cyclic AMP receptor protein
MQVLACIGESVKGRRLRVVEVGGCREGAGAGCGTRPIVGLGYDFGCWTKLEFGHAGGLAAVRRDGGEALSRSGDRQPDDGGRARAAPAVSLAAVWPDILARVPAEDRKLAERTLMLPLVSARDEDLADVITTETAGAFDFVIIDGVVLKETTLVRWAALELLGPGDVLAPPLTATRQLESRAVSRYLAHGRVSLAALGPHFRQARRRWPGIANLLHECLGLQSHRTSMHVAMLHQPRVEDRVIALFADLAERFGHVTADGILVRLPLTHDIIGGLVGSRRPTVTLALQQLASDGMLERLEDNRWKLARTIVSV